MIKDITGIKVTTNVLSLAKVKDQLKVLDISDIPLVDNTDTVANMIILELLRDERQLNTFFETILDTDMKLDIDLKTKGLSEKNYSAMVEKLSFFLLNIGKPILIYIKILTKELNVRKNMITNQMEKIMREKLELIDEKVNSLIDLDIPITTEMLD
jgi:hypothetical protein